MKTKTKEISQEEANYLYWRVINSDFGPADSDIVYELNERYEREMGKKPPKGWRNEDNE